MGFQSKTVPEEILKVEEITDAFGGFKAITELNFSLQRNELRVVIGRNGAGKTTLLDVITGKIRPRSGRVWFQPDERPRQDITGLPEQRIARLGIDHDMTFVRQIASRVTVLHEGKTLCEGRVQEVQRDPCVIEVYLGENRDEHAPSEQLVGGVR